jgi:LacI family transcriptional regulator
VRDACVSAGAQLTIVRCGDESLSATQAAVAGAIEQHGRPDAIIGGNDRMAMAALRWLASKHFVVPDEVKVTGFNGFDFAAYASPALTTVRSSAYEMGRRAGEELLASFENGRFLHRDIVLPVEFIPGSSS